VKVEVKGVEGRKKVKQGERGKNKQK